MIRTISLVLLGTAFAASIGCDTIASDDLNTSGIYPTLTVTATGDGKSEAIAVLRANSANSLNFVELGADDALAVKLVDDERALDRNELADYVYYNASFDTAPESTPYTFSLLRGVEADAPNSVVELPAAFSLSAVIGDDPLDQPAAWSPAAEALTLQWDVAAQPEPLTLEVLGACVDTLNATVPDDSGSYTVAAGLIVQSIDAEASCQVQIKLTRTRAGTVDPAFNPAGKAAGVQVRSLFVDVTFAPAL